ncbi:hypothetical protein Tco_0279755, partial [Tanacetum coccineum]
MCILLTKYLSISASITKASSGRSVVGTGRKVIGTFIQPSSVIAVFLFRSCFLVHVGSHCLAGVEPHKVYDILEPCGMVYDDLRIPSYVACAPTNGAGC